MTYRRNGGYIGPRNVPTTSVAAGVWTLIEQQEAKGGSIWPGVAPANSVLPAISGTTTVGQTLTVTNGTWAGAPGQPTFTFAYQWKRGATNVGTNANAYTLVSADAGSTMTCVVTATNTIGSTPATSAATATIAATVPGAPTIGTAVPGNTTAGVVFTAPADNGGATITSYTATAFIGGSPTAITATGATSPITVSGLTNGTSYTFKVKATNSAGTGPESAASNSVTPNTSVSTEYLVVAGGGAGGYSYAGAGGAGGLLSGTLTVTPGSNYTVTVGAGSAANLLNNTVAAQGSPSVFSSISTTGGGSGGPDQVTGTALLLAGGSGGGTAYNQASGVGGSGVSGQGNSGGSATDVNTAGGGGGAGAAGTGGSTGNGGNGVSSSITGTATYYAGGSGGWRRFAPASTGGLGGGQPG